VPFVSVYAHIIAFRAILVNLTYHNDCCNFTTKSCDFQLAYQVGIYTLMTHVEIDYISEINGCTPNISVGTRFERFSHVQEIQTGPGKIICDLKFKPFDTLVVGFSGKKWDDPLPTWLHMTNIELDHIRLDSVIMLGKQYPDYDDIDFDHRSSPRYYCPGTRFDLNGVYELEIYLPIWHFTTKLKNPND